MSKFTETPSICDMDTIRSLVASKASFRTTDLARHDVYGVTFDPHMYALYIDGNMVLLCAGDIWFVTERLAYLGEVYLPGCRSMRAITGQQFNDLLDPHTDFGSAIRLLAGVTNHA